MDAEAWCLGEYAIWAKWYRKMFPGPYGYLNTINEILKNHFSAADLNNPTILDCVCGTGRITIDLAKLGYKVVATDGSKEMLAEAVANAKKENLDIEFVAPTLWRELAERFGERKFDAVLCVGNSIYHQPPTNDGILVALINMYNVLKPGGICIVDTKTYDEDKRELWYDKKEKKEKLRTQRSYGPYRTSNGTVCEEPVPDEERICVDTDCYYDEDKTYCVKRQIIKCLLTLMRGNEVIKRQSLTVTGYPFPYTELEEWMEKAGFSSIFSQRHYNRWHVGGVKETHAEITQ